MVVAAWLLGQDCRAQTPASVNTELRVDQGDGATQVSPAPEGPAIETIRS